MPDLNGLEVLRILRQRYATAELPVIMVTAKDQSEDVVEAFNLGANDYVTKPIDFPVVLARIATQVSHKRAQAALRESEARYALAARGTNNGLWDWDLQTDEVYYSPRWKAMLGYEDGEIGTSPEEWLRRVHPDDVASASGRSSPPIARGLTPHFECEHRLLHKDQTYRWMLARGVAVRDCDGKGLRMAGSLTDITEGKVSDPLTGLPNRVLLMDRIERAIERSRRHPESRFAVLFLDLDRFKVVNDSLGHLVGDQLLIAFARRLEGCLRSTDTVSRDGGRAHHRAAWAAMNSRSCSTASKRPERRHPAWPSGSSGALAAPFNLDGHEVFTTASIGIALGGPGYHTAGGPAARCRHGDVRAPRRRGKARYEVFDSAMRARAVARLQLETELRRALERDEFRLHYQPIVALETDRTDRFRGPAALAAPPAGPHRPGRVHPDGRGDRADRARSAGGCSTRPAARWATGKADSPTLRPLIICVNLSSKQFFQAGLVEQVERRLRETGLDPRSLKLEITESAIMSDPESAAAMLDRLRSLGVQIGIDDFGTGYSSLSYLQQFPIDTLKIDRSFVQQDGRPTPRIARSSRPSCRWPITWAWTWSPRASRRSDQRDQLETLGCEYGQGFYFSRPVDGPDAEALLAGRDRSTGERIGRIRAGSPIDPRSGRPLPDP